MTDLSSLSDEELLAMYAMPALVKQESGGRPGVLGPQTPYGRAEGLTQMLPATAQEMAKKTGLPWRPELMRGTTPEAAAYQEQLGQAYLAQGVAETGNLRDGFRYYHGGPDRKKWGPKTEAYADAVLTNLGANGDAMAQPADLSQMSDEELLSMYQQMAPKPREVAASANRGVTIETLPPEAPAPRQVRPPIPRMAGSAPTQNPTIAQDAWSGFAQPFKDLGGAVMDRYREEKAQALAGPPASAGEALKRTLGGLGSMAGIAGDALGLGASFPMAAVRPAARAINRLPITPYVQDSPFVAPRPAQGEEAQALVEGALNQALSAARPATPKPTVPTPPKPKPMGVEELRAAKTAAYDVVDNMGVAYAPKATARLADDLGYDLAGKRINPKVTPKAHAVMEDIQAQLKSGAPVTISQIDDMRQQVWRATGKADDAEQFFGSRIREMLDDFIDGAGPSQVVNGNAPEAAAALNHARDINTRWRKVQEVANRTESADLRAASTYAGGNKANAVRQNLRPLIDPKSPQRIKNLTPAETKALNKAVRGTGTANVARQVGKVLDPRGLLGQIALGPIGIPTAGVAPTIGAISSEISNAATMKAVKDLVKLMSVGGAKPQAIPPRLPIMSLAGRPPVSLFSFPGAVGASELAAPLTRIPSAPSKKAGATKEPVRPRKK